MRTCGHMLLWAVVLAGCAASPPPRTLVDARNAYKDAQSGEAARLTPADLVEAKLALDRAEQAFSDDPDSEKTMTLAYVAWRTAELVQVQARIKAGQIKREEVWEQIRKMQTDGLERIGGKLTKTEHELEAERKAREVAEQRAREALQKVAEAAALAVKQEPRGTVIVLPGEVLFASGKSELLPLAQQKISLLTAQLKDQETAEITVEGHTDSRGSDSSNLALSQRRADAVRIFLIGQGIPPAQIKAVGVGEARPVADNKTSEGRAQNRRVEIVVKPGEPR